MRKLRRFTIAMLLATFLVCSGMTCEGTAPVNDLNAPKGLSCDGDQNDPNSIRIKFWAYNNEGISGYNVYIYTGAPFNAWNTAKTAVESNISNENFTNNYYDNNYIISRIGTTVNIFPTITSATTSTDASIVYNQLISDSGRFYTEFPYIINYTGVDTGFPVAIDLTSFDYYIGVTAVDQNNVVESKISNIIRVYDDGFAPPYTCLDI